MNKNMVDSAIKKDNNSSDILSKIMMLNEVAAILYQVNDFDTAVDMILDTCTEYLKFDQIGILIEDANSGEFKIKKYRNINSIIVESLHFAYNDSLNEKKIDYGKINFIDINGGILNINNKIDVKLPDITSFHLLPIIYHDRVLGFLIIVYSNDKKIPNDNILKLLQIISVQIAPVLFSFDSVCKSTRKSENIINKIIRDRIHEAQMVLSPVSFSLFRIIPNGAFETSLPLEETIKTYKKIFSERLDPLGDTIWLTPDTIFFIFPKADLFKTESLCGNLKQEIETKFSLDNSDFSLSLRYVCLSYPQSGKETIEIVNKLWFKLFEEMSELNSKIPITGKNTFN